LAVLLAEVTHDAFAELLAVIWENKRQCGP
jgi:hypothetical protein